MKFGINLPQFGAHASAAAIRQVALEAERLGCEAVWVQERLLRPTNPLQAYGGMMMPWPESYRVVFDPIETLTYAAAVTQRIRVGTSVLDALFHPPLVLARRLATLDQLSGGRLTVALGQGWSEDEFASVNVPLKRRGAGFEEFVLALRAVWGPDPASFAGRFYRIPESEIGPKPLQQPHPPLLAGGFTPAALQRAARLGMGYNPVLIAFGMLEDGIRSFREAARAAGRDAARVSIVVRANAMIGAAVPGERGAMTGSLDQVKEDVRRVADLGVDHLFFDFYLTPQVTPDQQLRHLEALMAAV